MQYKCNYLATYQARTKNLRSNLQNLNLEQNKKVRSDWRREASQITSGG
ncbi:hypothetical protein [Pseudanabaena sp. SR411]|jgi:hypothetical protein|nr:hypothetical protein [Pseudanabaena sp. SR411]